MIHVVVLSDLLQKKIRKRAYPEYVLKKLYAWIEDVHTNGLNEVRKRPGFHDEPLKGWLQGMRSIRLSREWRAYYVLVEEELTFVRIERLDKHEY